VRGAVTENRSTPTSILTLLSEDKHPDIRFSLSENPHLPRPILTKLVNDENPYIACRAWATLDRLNKETDPTEMDVQHSTNYFLPATVHR
jgi:hypothetical protein